MNLFFQKVITVFTPERRYHTASHSAVEISYVWLQSENYFIKISDDKIESENTHSSKNKSAFQTKIRSRIPRNAGIMQVTVMASIVNRE